MVSRRLVITATLLLLLACSAEAGWGGKKKQAEEAQKPKPSVMQVFTLPLASKVLTLYAGIMSFRALQSLDVADDKQWLTFWLVFALFDLACFVGDIVGWILPFYHEAKVGFIVFLGVFGGAGKVYPVLEPFLLKGDKVAKKYEPIILAKMKEMKAAAEANGLKVGDAKKAPAETKVEAKQA